MRDEIKPNLRIVRDDPTDDLTTTRARGLSEVLAEARARENTAIKNSRLADAALYREIGDRAEHVLREERKLKALQGRRVDDVQPIRLTLSGDEGKDDLPDLRNGRTTERDESFATPTRGASRLQRGLILFCICVVLASASFFLTGCSSNMPAVDLPRGTVLEVSAGQAVPSARGSDDIGDVGPFGVAEVGFAGGEHAYKGEFWIQGGGIDATDVDAGALGLFDLEADVYRFGVGMRTTPRRSLGLDWSLGLGACLTVVSGEASAGAMTADVNESGLGAYVGGDVCRGPLFLRVRYIDGPEAEIEDVDVELGGLSVTGGLRWSF